MTIINLNADVGESYGHFQIGNDKEMMRFIKSASIACGFHAGDPIIMGETIQLAKENSVSVGAHPGFNDLWGFGRREIKMSAREIEYMIAYQIGALSAIAAGAGMKVTHVKPHGALSNMAHVDSEYAAAIARAIKSSRRMADGRGFGSAASDKGSGFFSATGPALRFAGGRRSDDELTDVRLPPLPAVDDGPARERITSSGEGRSAA